MATYNFCSVFMYMCFLIVNKRQEDQNKLRIKKKLRFDFSFIQQHAALDQFGYAHYSKSACKVYTWHVKLL